MRSNVDVGCVGLAPRVSGDGGGRFSDHRFFVSTSMATIMPILLKRLGVDPAVAAGPFVTTANDITGISIYLTLATIFLEYLR